MGCPFGFYLNGTSQHPHHRPTHARRNRPRQHRPQAEIHDVPFPVLAHCGYAAEHESGAAEIGEAA